MIFHIAKTTVLLCGKATHDHFHFPAARVTQEVLDNPRTCAKCIEVFKESK